MRRNLSAWVWMVVSVCAVVEPAKAADTLEAFSQQCDQATGVAVPDFDCDSGTLVPTTHPTSGGQCDRPNALNQQCDPGSRFQVLTQTSAAYVVAHCRKRGLGPGRYGDIAVIQHNTRNGATCFYQGALGQDTRGQVQAPSKGVGAQRFWMTPSEIAGSSFACVRCHDNGPIIRSPYLSQITGANRLPGAGDHGFNRNQPYAFVGSDFANWKAFKVEVDRNFCNGCHRMGSSNAGGGGTARDLGIRATAASQAAKNPHSSTSPMWMLPGQTAFNAAHADFAMEIKRCADRAPLPNSPPCRLTLFASAYVQPAPEPTPRERCLKACAIERDQCMAQVPTPGGPRPQQCVREWRACNAACPS